MKNIFFTFFIIILTAFSRLAVADVEHGNFSFDSGNFALALQDYSIENDRPHLPGYILYVQFLKALSALTAAPGAVASVIFSSISAGLLFLLFKTRFPQAEALLLALFVVLNPMAWFSGATAEIYSFDLMFSAALVLAGISGRGIYITPIIMALGGGFRQSSPFLLLPLYVYLWWRFLKTPAFSFKKFLASQAAGIAVVVLWLVPMVYSTGGFKKYFTLFQTNSPLPPTSFFQNLAQFAGFGVFLFAPFLIVLCVSVYNFFLKGRHKARPQNFFTTICLWWLVPPFLFFLFGHYNASYFLICIGGAAGLTGVLFKNSRQLFRAAFSAGIIFSVIIFLATPFKTPPVETFFVPQMRNITQWEVFKSRVFSAYLLTASRIQHTAHQTRATQKFIRQAASGASSEAVFFDPAFPLVARALQASSALPLITLNVREPGAYYQYAAISQTGKSGFKNILPRCIIATRRDFADSFLREFSFKSRTDMSGLSFVKIHESDAGRLAALYDSLFVRR